MLVRLNTLSAAYGGEIGGGNGGGRLDKMSDTLNGYLIQGKKVGLWMDKHRGQRRRDGVEHHAPLQVSMTGRRQSRMILMTVGQKLTSSLYKMSTSSRRINDCFACACNF